jgi:hypothetical protein
MAMAVVAALAGCSPPATGDGRPLDPSASDTADAALPAVTARAVLDWEDASIGLPLAHYGMSSREEQISLAAASIVFARCATGQ